ncbi:MAG: methyltransferase domain-containing protein [Myxococcales bacterium]|nr:methyltransferase domain-containing protein [Myxococcales bacterium]
MPEHEPAKASLLFLTTQPRPISDYLPLIEAARALRRIGDIVAVGALSEANRRALAERGVRSLSLQGGASAALKAGLAECRDAWVILQDPAPGYSASDYPALLQPLVNREADAVYGVRFHRTSGDRLLATSPAFSDAALSLLTSAITDLRLSDLTTGMRAFRTDLLRAMPISASGEGLDVELAIKLAAQLFRFHEVPIHVEAEAARPTLREQLDRAATLVRYALLTNDADGLHEGYTTLLRMEEGAPRYNAWLGRKLARHLGQRVLEVGAGIGTITRQIAPGRELVVALEMDRFYYDRLVNLFAGLPQVRPLLSGVERADWERLAEEDFDSVLLSNVLEHIADDREALSNFRRVLRPGGRLVCLVPALPALFGSMDSAVGHFRRYSKAALTGLFEGCGFRVQALESLNVLGIPGWFINGRLLQRRGVPPLQLRAYDLVSPLVARVEERLKPSVGMSLLIVGEAG